MPSFDIVKHNEIGNKSFRVAQLYDQYDLTENSFDERFSGEIDPPTEWNIGVIVGKSGTGKTTIARELFGNYFVEFNYSANCVIDDFDKSLSSSELFGVLSSVGFSSPPSWLKPYSVLSNGEKMRVDLARAILQKQEIIIFDEYTSVVDREVAQIGSLALQKSVRRASKKFIAVTCHYDVIDWLEPDWVFSTDTMEMKITRGLVRRPPINVEIREIKGYWDLFRRYHYLSHELNKSAHQYVAFYRDKPIAFCAVINFPHNKIKPMWKIHRIVVLPDYQGIGIANKMMDAVASVYVDRNEYFGITTSLNGFARALMKNKNWILQRAGRMVPNMGMQILNATLSRARNTYSFRYRPERKTALDV